MKLVAWFVALLTLVAAGAYTAVSLARWEWSRALFFGLVFVAAELAVVGAAVLGRLAHLERRLDEAAPPAAPSALGAVRSARDDHVRFPWLRVDPTDVVERSNVFVTMLVGGGVLLTGGAWIIDRIARATVDPGREVGLGRQLDAIAYPDGLVVDDVVSLARPRPHREDPRLDAFLGSS